MTNVPTNSTDDALKNVAVEQPEKTAAESAAVVEETHEEPQAEATEVAVNAPETEVTATAADAAAPEPAKAEEASAETAPAEAKPAEEPAKAEETSAETAPAEAKPAEEPAKAEEACAESAPAEVKPAEEPAKPEVPASKEAVVERLQVLADHPEQSETEELNMLKQAFYRYVKEDKQKAYNQFVKDGGNAEDYRPEPEPLEEQFKKLMGIVKEHRAKIQEAVEKQKEANLKKKQAIVEKIKSLSTSPEEANKNYDEFRRLQDEWKEIKPIPQSEANEAWKSFQFVVEQYYDLLKENNALRDYDFKKNLEAKTKLCEEAEKLMDNPDIVQAARQLQQLHQEFREIGPVAKDLRESLWERFKVASSAVNKRQAQYFEALKAKEEENLARKTALCEELENIEVENIKSSSEWDTFTKKIIDIQKQWKEIGRATKKMNVKIYERYRAACDKFFAKKAEFFKAQREMFAQNAAKRQALIDQAEALKDGTEWGSITNKLIQLQKEWKEIGPVAFRTSNALWETFNGACNHFFERKKEALGDQYREEADNLTKKKTIIDKLEAVAIEGGEAAAQKVKELMDEWNATGHVPFKEKDKIYARYREVVDRLFKELDLSSLRRNRGPRRNEKPARRADGTDKQHSSSLYRLYEAKKAELATYENNITFLSSHSKSGNALIDSMNKKIDALKAELVSMVEKINAQEAQAQEGSALQASAPAEPETKAPAPETPASAPAAADEPEQKPAE
jgi:hypothetical protein